MDDVNDQVLLQAMRKRILEDIQGGGGARGGAQSVTNNIYGGGVGGTGAAAGEMPMPEQDRDYFVDILREDLPINQETGKPAGWKKKVHRFTAPKNADADDLEKKN